MGWYLRLSRAHELVVLARPDHASIMEEAVRIQDHWELSLEPGPDHVRAVFIRKQTRSRG